MSEKFWDVDGILKLKWVFVPELGKCRSTDSDLNHDFTKPLGEEMIDVILGTFRVYPLKVKRKEIISDGKEAEYEIFYAVAKIDFKNRICSVTYKIEWEGGLQEEREIPIFIVDWFIQEDSHYEGTGVSFMYLSIFPEGESLEGITSPLSIIMTASEADERWGKPSGTVRVAIARGRFDSQIERGMVRQSGKVWLVTEQAMNEVFDEIVE